MPSIFRILFQVPYPVTPAFATLTKTVGVVSFKTNVFLSGRLPVCPLPPSIFMFSQSFVFMALRTLLHFFALLKNSTHFFSINSALFAKKQGFEEDPLVEKPAAPETNFPQARPN